MRLPVLGAALLLGMVGCKEAQEAQPAATVTFEQPVQFPSPTYDFSQNPVTPAGFELGRALFYDPILSRDGTVSCGFCHLQTSGFTQHGHVLSHGIDGLLTTHNSQPIQNLAWSPNFGWDGGIDQLDLFAVNPITNPHEMGDNLGNVLAKLRRRPGYRDAFAKAFGDTAITTARFLKALSQFQLLCVSANSRYDKVLAGKAAGFNPRELAGKAVFEAKCARCHSGIFFTDFAYHHNGLPVRNRADSGRQRITGLPQDRFRYRTPSLRNVVITAPYMHDGRILNLRGVLDHYSNGVVDEGYTDASLLTGTKPGIPLTDGEKDDLIAFLTTLTDTTFLTDKRLEQPSQLP